MTRNEPIGGNSAAAIAHPNIAFIKYWGNRDPHLRIPLNSSLSMNLGALTTTTRVTYSPDLEVNRFQLNGKDIKGAALARVSDFIDRVRSIAHLEYRAMVISDNNFPTGAGIASSAAAFAALALAASFAAGLHLDEKSLSRLARIGSGSASRSVPGGFVEWQAGETDDNSFAFSIADPEHWELIDCIAIVAEGHKPMGSTQGHALASSSPLQAARLASAPQRLDLCRKAILERDFEAFARVTELDSNLMHAVMMTSTPNLLYWQPATLAIMHQVMEWRQKQGVEVCYTIDAGPNVHVICPVYNQTFITQRLENIPGVKFVLNSPVGGPARLI
jgi:diphosphomevalonate decarboxylase